VTRTREEPGSKTLPRPVVPMSVMEILDPDGYIWPLRSKYRVLSSQNNKLLFHKVVATVSQCKL